MNNEVLTEYEKEKYKLEYNKAKERLSNSLKLYRFAVSNGLLSEIIFLHQRVNYRQIELENIINRMPVNM